MSKVMTIRLDILKCDCGDLLVRKEGKLHYTCETCGTSMTGTGRILVKGSKLVRP